MNIKTYVKIISLLLILIIAFSLSACGEKPAKTDANGYADQSAFLKDMAKGIQKRLAAVDDEKHANDTDEQKAEYYKSLVNCELDQIEKYENAVFEDTKFNELAHHYIHAVQMQKTGAENLRNVNLYNALWSGGKTIRNGIIVTLYEKYDLPIDSNTVANYTDGEGGYTISWGSSSGTSSELTDKTPYKLGDAITTTCEDGEAIISLDSVTIKGKQILFSATNHGDLGFSNQNGSWEIKFYDADRYAIGRGSVGGGSFEPLKPGATVNYMMDYSYGKYASKATYISIEYFAFSGSDNPSWLDKRVVFNYAFDLAGNQIDYYSLIQ